MKKKLYYIICLYGFISVMLCACGKQGNPIRLPDKEDVISISVSDGEKRAMFPVEEGESAASVGEILSILLDMEVTNKESINDVPVNKDSITINLNCSDNSGTTLFYYEDKGTEYVEQPYQGIYKPAPALGFYITELLDAAGSTPETVVFQATVIEASTDSILAKPIDGSLELNSADQFRIQNKEQLELQTGDLIEITYNGDILETYPAQLGETYKITVIEQICFN